MSGCATKLVFDECVRPSLNESSTSRLDQFELAAGRLQSQHSQVRYSPHVVVNRTFGDDFLKVFLNRCSPRNDYAKADSSFTVQPLKILEVAIIEWVFVIPLDF